MKTKSSSLWPVSAAGLLSLGMLTSPLHASISDELIVHLKFDNSLSDASGKGHDGSPVGNVIYVPGAVGQGVRLSYKRDGSEFNYVTLGAPEALNFGLYTDFSVSFWTRFTQWGGDPSFIANKNWQSGSNQGWIIATGGDGRIQWNAGGAPGSRKDYDSEGGVFSDGQWHHVVVTFLRAGEFITYVDGLEKNVTDTSASLNNLNTPIDFATNIGQDGTGTYTDGGGVDWGDLEMDDIGIWTRVLTAADVQAIYTAGIAGQDLSTAESTPEAPFLVVEPQSANVIAGENVNLKVIPRGTSPFQIQWFKGEDSVEGATNAVYAIQNVQANAAGSYRVTVTNPVSTAEGGPAQLTVDTTQAPNIIRVPANQVAGPGGRVNFEVEARGVDPLTYEWFFKGDPIPNSNSSTLTVSGIQPSNAGAYSVSVKAGNGTSSPAGPVTLTVISDIKQDLVAHLTFDDTYNDATARANNGFPVGTPTFIPGKIGTKAIALSSAADGSAFNYVTLGQPLDLDFGGDIDFSVAAWVRFTDWQGDPVLIGNKNWNSGGNVGWVIATASNGRFKWNFREQALSRVDYDGPGGTLSDGQWHHIAVTFQRGGFARSYLDGKLVDTRALPTVLTSIDPFQPLNIGQDGTGTYTDGGRVSWGNLAMDDVAIWRRVITSDEVLNIYNRGEYFGANVQETALTDDLVVYLPFEGDFTDASGRDIHGEAVGAPSFVAGPVGRGLRFNYAQDGSSYNYVTLGGPLELNFGIETDFTVAFWGQLQQWAGDPAFIGNKSWNSGGNQGWIIATGGDGRIQWNLGDGDAGGRNRADYDSAGGLFNDGEWHHVVVVFDRANATATTYFDGTSLNTTPIPANVDSVSTPAGLATNIGQDGTGTYTDGGGVGVGDGRVDEVALWRRALNPNQVAVLFQRGEAGRNLFNQEPPAPPAEAPEAVASITDNALNIQIEGGTGPFVVQMAIAVEGPWISVLSTSDRAVELPLIGNTAFVRVVDGMEADIQLYRVELSGTQEVPAVTSPATGSGYFAVQGDVASYLIAYNGTIGAVSASHLHGPAAMGVNAGVFFHLLPSPTFPAGTRGGYLMGQQTLQPAQKTALEAGNTYVNIHTSSFPGGEIRGQVLP